MTRRHLRVAVLLCAVSVPDLSGPAYADSGCDALAQGAATGLAATVQADDATIHKPQSVTALTCLDGFFKGVGLDVITSGLDPAKLLDSVVGKICTQIESAWESDAGNTQCGLTLTGFNLGLNLQGGGSFCPKLSFGGGDGDLASIGGGTGATNGLLVNGQKQLPDGYSVFGNAQ